MEGNSGIRCLASALSSVIHQDSLCNLQRVPDTAETKTINPTTGKNVGIGDEMGEIETDIPKRPIYSASQSIFVILLGNRNDGSSRAPDLLRSVEKKSRDGPS